MSTRFVRFVSVLSSALLVSLALSGCVDRREVTKIEAHPDQFTETGSADFHGTLVLREGVESCRSCHGVELKGESAAPSCASSDCHDGAGGHPNDWAVRGSEHFHATEVAREGNAECANCHGSNFRGGWSGVSCYDCHAGGPSGHPDGWMDERSSSFHGQEVILHGVTECTECHGFGLSGGTSGVACGDCHH
ncbi:MAG: hypothetical protein U0527_00680 [Candidatus Eisenbacteria bacterium]